MPNEHDQQSPSDIAKSYVALNALRDYVYQQKPKRFLSTDFIEDIPGLRPFATPFANVLPSAATISNDPAVRHEQIQAAVHKVNQASKKDHPVAQEAISSALKFGLGSIPLSLAFGMAEKSLHVPGIKGIWRGERPRFTFKDNFATQDKRDELKNYLLDSARTGVMQGAAFGATPVLLSSRFPIDKKHLDTAAKVLNEHPGIASMPGADLAALNNINKSKHENPTKAHIENTLAGGAAGGLGALAVQGSKTVGGLIHNMTNPLLTRARNSFGKTMRNMDRSMTPRGMPNEEMKGRGLGGNTEFRNMRRQIRHSLNTHFPINAKPSMLSREEILKPLSLRSMSKPVLGMAALGLGLSGLGSYMTHPAHKDV